MTCQTRNEGWYDRWTCPKCYNDLPDKAEGESVCQNCGAKLSLYIETQPVCVTECIDDMEDE